MSNRSELMHSSSCQERHHTFLKQSINTILKSLGTTQHVCMFLFCVVGRCWVSEKMVIVLTPGMIVSCAPLISTRPSVSSLLAQLAGTRRYLDIMINGSSLDWVATPPARYHTALNIKIHILNSTSWNKYLVFHWNLLWYVFCSHSWLRIVFTATSRVFSAPHSTHLLIAGQGSPRSPESASARCITWAAGHGG